MDLAESIVNTVAIYKKLRSNSPHRAGKEYLYVIQSPNLAGLAIYSKGKLVREGGVNTCPSCGSRRIEKLRRDWDGDFEGKHYVVHDLEYYACPACEECVFDREAMRKIEARSPAFARMRMRRTA